MRVTTILWAKHAPTSELQTLLEQVYKRYDRKRRNIIDPTLCTSTLDVLKPSLPAPGTCDIIDVNPGACIWTKSLHDVVKPRRHVLVEADRKNFNPVLEPLLSERSSYRYAEDIRSALDPKNRLLSTETKESGNNDHAGFVKRTRNEFNNNLLITANLSGRFIHMGAYSGTISKHFLEQYYRSLTARSTTFDIHEKGLVRLLAWIPENEKYSIIPRTVVARTPQSIRLEASCHIREIASSYPYSDTASIYRRWYNADLENISMVAEKQKSTKFEIPADRVQPLPEPPSAALVPTRSNFPDLIKLEMRPMLIDELVALDKHLQTTSPEWLIHYSEWKPKKGNPSKQEVKQASRPKYSDSEKEKYNLLMKRFRSNHNAYRRVESVVNRRRALEDQVIQLAQLSGQDIDAYKERIQEFETEFAVLRGATSELFKDSRHAIEKALDDYRCMRHEPPVLAWNGRDFEPILCKKSDFFPQMRMTLVEFIPKPEFVQAFDTAEKQISFDYIIFCLDWERASPLSVALKRIVGEAYDDFLKQVPNLLDPTKGGWYDLDRITPRTLPTSLLVELALVFDKWVHRPSLSRMITTLSTALRQQKDRFH